MDFTATVVGTANFEFHKRTNRQLQHTLYSAFEQSEARQSNTRSTDLNCDVCGEQELQIG